MSKIIISPGKYIQGKGELSNLQSYTSGLGKNVLILASNGTINRLGDKIKQSYTNSDSNLTFTTFNGECSREEIDSIREVCATNSIDVIVSVGGGKTLDAGKATAYYQQIPVVVVPTIASTDAPCSALSVVYTPNGEFESYLFLPSNPAAVIMDTDIIVNAPSRFLVAGMGDALATYFEARAAVSTHSGTCAAVSGACENGTATKAAFALSKLCYDILIKEGYPAKLAVDQKCVTTSVENVIEANTLLSGLGFESGGLAAAHAIHNGLTVLDETHHYYHGEKVAFGTIAQLVLENSPREELEEVINFCKSVGLPTTLKEIGINDIVQEDIMKVAKAATVEGETIHNMPGTVTADDVYSAILTADALGTNL